MLQAVRQSSSAGVLPSVAAEEAALAAAGTACGVGCWLLPATGALGVGWLIGRGIDQKFLHLSGDIGQFSDTHSYLSSSMWVHATASSIYGQPYMEPKANGYVLEWRAFYIAGNLPFAKEDCSGPGKDCSIVGDGRDWSANHEAYQFESLVQLSTLNHLDAYSCGSGCQAYFREISEADFRGRFQPDAAPTDYVGQAHALQSTIPTPVKPAFDSAAGQDIRDRILADNDTAAWVAHELDPGHNQDPYSPTSTVPDCLGLSVADCTTRIRDMGFTGTINDVELGLDDAVLTEPAGAVLSTSPAGGATADKTATITITNNPTPLPIVWLAPQFEETYSAYVARLRASGWVGTEMTVSLSSEDGEDDFAADGAPCTSVLAGTRVWPGDGATIYRNPTSFADTDADSGNPGCGAATPSGAGQDECGMSGHRFKDLLADPVNGDFYRQACADAWAYLRASGILRADGTLDPAVVAAARDFKAGEELGNPKVKQALTADGSQMSDWEKVASLPIVGAPRPIHLRFYRKKITYETNLSIDFKIVFNDYFAP